MLKLTIWMVKFNLDTWDRIGSKFCFYTIVILKGINHGCGSWTSQVWPKSLNSTFILLRNKIIGKNNFQNAKLALPKRQSFKLLNHSTDFENLAEKAFFFWSSMKLRHKLTLVVFGQFICLSLMYLNQVYDVLFCLAPLLGLVGLHK